MALFAVGLVLLAFIPQYFGHQRMSFPVAWAIRMHAAIMNAWIAMFFVQAYLGATGRTTQHRKIGKFGIALGWLALFSMISVQYRSLLLNPLPEEMQTYNWLLPFLYVYLTFSAFLFLAYRYRAKPDWHKRFITFALFLSLEAVVQRLHWLPGGFGYWPFAVFLDICLLLPLIVFDTTTRQRKVHPATARGALGLLAAQSVLLSLWGTTTWRHFAYVMVHTLTRR